MSNLLPSIPQKKARNDLRARFLLAVSLVLLCCAALFALALAPAEVALVFFSPPAAQTATGTVDLAEDNAAIAHSAALFSAMQSFSTTTSLADISAALADKGTGVSIQDISYSISGRTVTLEGRAQTSDDVNTFREALQNDPDFSDVSVPVSALIGSQNGTFTMTMNVTR